MGLFVGVLYGFIINWTYLNWIQWGCLFFTLLIPTFAQPWFQIKLYKIISRLFLGIVCGLSIHGLIRIEHPLHQAVFYLLYLMIAYFLYKILMKIRNSKIDNPCTNCDLGLYPTCEWNIDRLIKSTGNSDLINKATNSKTDLKSMKDT